MTRVLLDATLDTLFAQQNDLVHAIIDFSVDAPVTSRCSLRQRRPWVRRRKRLPQVDSALEK